MSHVTSIVLKTPIYDFEDCARLRKFLSVYDMLKVSKDCGGRNNMQIDVYISAHNYLSVDNLIADFNNIGPPEFGCRELLFQDEHDEEFRRYKIFAR